MFRVFSLVVVLIVVVLLVMAAAIVRPSAALPSLRRLFDTEQQPLELPVNVKVVLLGFQGDGGYDYALSADRLHNVLERTMPHHDSYLRSGSDADPGSQKLGVRYGLTFEVLHADHSVLGRYESALRAALRPAQQQRRADLEYPTYQVRIAGLEHTLRTIYEPFAGSGVASSSSSPPQQFGPRDSQGAHANENQFTVIVVNPDKRRMVTERMKVKSTPNNDGPFDPRDPEAIDHFEGGYYYRFTNDQGAAQCFVGFDNFVLIDVSAGPGFAGSLLPTADTTSYAVSPDSSVRYSRVLRQYGGEYPQGADAIDSLFMADISSLILSAVDMVFLPDIAFESTYQADRLILPFIELVDSDLDKRRPLLSKSFLSNVEKQISSLLLPHQKLGIYSSVKSLGDHPYLHLALEKASFFTMESVYSHGHEPKESQRMLKRYYDGDILLAELRKSEDRLTTDFLHSFDELNSLLNPLISQIPVPLMDGREGDSSPSLNSKLPQGVRVLPVYVFSLEKRGPALFKNHEAVKASKDCVIVLNYPDGTELDTPFYEDTIGHTYVSHVHNYRHILSGVTQTLGGIVSPLDRSLPPPLPARIDFTWSLGYHPFGPYGGNLPLSNLLAHLTLRNNILSRTHTALDILKDAAAQLEDLVGEYAGIPFGVIPNASAIFGEGTYATRKVEQLAAEVEQKQTIFNDLSRMFQSGQFSTAYWLSDTFLQTSARFRSYVGEELDALGTLLRCCERETKSG